MPGLFKRGLRYLARNVVSTIVSLGVAAVIGGLVALAGKELNLGWHFYLAPAIGFGLIAMGLTIAFLDRWVVPWWEHKPVTVGTPAVALVDTPSTDAQERKERQDKCDALARLILPVHALIETMNLGERLRVQNASRIPPPDPAELKAWVARCELNVRTTLGVTALAHMKLFRASFNGYMPNISSQNADVHWTARAYAKWLQIQLEALTDPDTVKVIKRP
jgi:hypothetical protein